MSAARPCFHCGEALPAGAPIFAALGNLHQPVCCIGCKAVAEFIHSSGLAAFYEHRTEPREDLGLRADVVEGAGFRHYDRDDLLQRYVHLDGNAAEASIDIGGMYCSACVWLLNSALQRSAAVQDVSVNPATRRAVIRWDISRLPFSELLGAISRVGFKPQPTAPGLAGDDNASEQRTALRRLIVAAAAGMQVMMFAFALYAGEHYGIEGQIEHFLRVISLLVCIPIVFYSARPFFAGAVRGLRARSPGMDLPVSLAILAAFVASAWATLLGAGEIYFDSVAMFVLFLSATRYVEMRARHRSDDYTQALARLLPETVTRVRDGAAEIVSLDEIRVGDTILLRPGDVVPVDGVVRSGELAIDESLLTGEPMPVARKPGTDVFAGSINRVGNASVEVAFTGAGTSLAEIGRLLERARSDRPRIAVLADRVAGKFVLGVIGVTVATGAAWISMDPSRAFEIVLATLVVTCPCALALATPAALATAASRLARDGFLLVRSRVLDVLTRKPVIVFDKTGTLTEGRPAIVETEILPHGRDHDAGHYIGIAAAIETASEHVLARAFARFEAGGTREITACEVEPGAGVAARVDGVLYRIGSRRYLDGFCPMPDEETAPDPADDTLTEVWLGDREGALARFRIGDELRADAADAVAELERMGHRIVIASGDRESSVAAAAGALGIGEWHSALTPASKLKLIAELRADGERVLMVGDGINDAPVLAAADASIAIDAGTALARASADAVVVGKRLATIVDAAVTARDTRRIIRQNIVWAIGYNVTAVPLAAAGLLAPWMAALGMSLSSLIVVTNALRLRRPRDRRPARHAGAADTPVSREALT